MTRDVIVLLLSPPDGREQYTFADLTLYQRYWSRLDGDGTIVWADAVLTEQGIKDAKELGAFWREAILVDKIPAAETHLVSPLTRGLQTARYTFGSLDLSENRPFHPVAKEALREIYGVHTCDRRRNRSWIEAEFPEAEMEQGFTEADKLWTPDRRETMKEAIQRTRRLLEDLFANNDSTFVSLTTHSGAIRALQAATGHPDVWVGTSAVVPIMVRGQEKTSR